MVVEYSTSQHPGIISLIKQLVSDVGNLLIQHLELFRQEIREDAEMAAKYTSIALAGALVAFISLIFLGLSIILIFNLFMPVWVASLIVTALYSIIAAIAIIIAKHHLQMIKKTPTVSEMKKTLEEAQKWLQELK